jgi:hypothetical protein
MQFTTSVILLLTSALTSAAPLKARDASTVLTDISNISSDVATLTSDVNSYNGNLLNSLGLITAVDNLKSSLTTGTSDTTSSSAFSDADSASIVSALQALVPNVVTVLSDLDAKVLYLSITYTSRAKTQ